MGGFPAIGHAATSIADDDRHPRTVALEFDLEVKRDLGAWRRRPGMDNAVCARFVDRHLQGGRRDI